MAKAENRRLIEALSDLDNILAANIWREVISKNVAESSKARQEGNKIFTDRSSHDAAKHVEILRLYSRSVAYAPIDSEELGLAYGNRSAALMHIGKYQPALEDIKRAIQLPVSELHVLKYLVRKVQCEAELGLEDARGTCEEAKLLLEEIEVSDKLKKDMVVKLVNSIVKLEKKLFSPPEPSKKLQFLENTSEPSDSPGIISNLLSISYNPSRVKQGRHLTVTRDVGPGEVLYACSPYVVCPIETRIYNNCSHCLSFAWACIPCDSCVYAMYCSQRCKDEAKDLYHDIECKVIGRSWKVYETMNAGRLMSVKMLVMAIREAGGLEELKKHVEEIDACKDTRRRGFSNDQTVFLKNFRAVYSLVSNARNRSDKEQNAISRDSAVLLYFLARYTPIFKSYFDHDKKALARNDDALFVGRLLSHYQHVVISNAVMVRDLYTESTTDWSWKPPKEENGTGLYLSPFLSLINHSCYPNVARCEMADRRTVLFSTRPIAKGEQIYLCYGPHYYDMIKSLRHELLERFYFTCDCIACEQEWPLLLNMMSSGLTYKPVTENEFKATSRALENCEVIVKKLEEGSFTCDLDALNDLAYAIVLVLKHCKLPNWRIASLSALMITLFNNLYGYVIDVPTKC
ncbi:hypothetical protein TSAR_013643 [Trichomalopsis sarcophagae]|uniref:Protein-lysine N-methyltransferase SMYD4 n=1 Tax=Trichomalopsis sarcophagae TaxID=543379 RepID=A0A232EWB6_9HYME|nr:hypothetical protein TSAR_013643 [Trichomalopsis sarcophagae]